MTLKTYQKLYNEIYEKLVREAEMFSMMRKSACLSHIRESYPASDGGCNTAIITFGEPQQYAAITFRYCCGRLDPDWGLDFVASSLDEVIAWRDETSSPDMWEEVWANLKKYELIKNGLVGALPLSRDEVDAIRELMKSKNFACRVFNTQPLGTPKVFGQKTPVTVTKLYISPEDTQGVLACMDILGYAYQEEKS